MTPTRRLLQKVNEHMINYTPHLVIHLEVNSDVSLAKLATVGPQYMIIICPVDIGQFDK